MGEADPSKGFSNPKSKLGVTSHFLEIIKQQLECVSFFGELCPREMRMRSSKMGAASLEKRKRSRGKASINLFSV